MTTMALHIIKYLLQLGQRGGAYYHVLQVTVGEVDVLLRVGGSMVPLEACQNQSQLGRKKEGSQHYKNI